MSLVALALALALALTSQGWLVRSVCAASSPCCLLLQQAVLMHDAWLILPFDPVIIMHLHCHWSFLSFVILAVF